MEFARRRAPRSLLILLWTLLAVAPSACVQAPPVFQIANTCSDLIPDGWTSKGVDSAPLPTDSTVGGWIGFGVAQTGQLDKANGQTRDAVEIVKKCEARDRAAFEAMKPQPWWHFW